ncbi:MAG: hypothetical protein ICV83_17355 [Cytophagales bacterium]|nr:hypothetical protein [Cytophagales bacterium]
MQQGVIPSKVQLEEALEPESAKEPEVVQKSGTLEVLNIASVMKAKEQKSSPFSNQSKPAYIRRHLQAGSSQND